MNRLTVFFLLPLLLLAGRSLGAQRGADTGMPLETFVQQVTYLWGQGDVGRLMELVPEDGPVVLDTGSGTETVNGRHAAAALRALFSGRESVSARPIRITLAGGTPPRGFGEVSWSFRTRGAPGPQTRSVYIGARWEGSGWRINELRVLP